MEDPMEGYDVGLAGLKKPIDRLNILRIFPAMFTTVCAFLFVVPVWVVLGIESTTAVSYFSSSWRLVVLVIPAIIVAVHLVHLKTGAPSRAAVFLGLVAPSVILLIVANSQYVMAADKTDKLFSGDCDAFPEKRALQRSWDAAYKLYAKCLEDTSRAQGIPVAELQARFRVEDCEEYETGLHSTDRMSGETRERDWKYLKEMEETHLCAGWCYQGVQLWAQSHHRDSCSVAVSSLFEHYVRPHASQVGAMMLAVLATSAILIVVLGPVLRHLGLEW